MNVGPDIEISGTLCLMYQRLPNVHTIHLLSLLLLERWQAKP